MTWELALYALLGVFVLAALLALLGNFGISAQDVRPLESYLLAGGSLGRVSVINLLLSSSFGLNSVFYQVYLGYMIGAWGLIIQAAWALSFYLLSFNVPKIRESKGLHDFIGVHFGYGSRLAAGLCSLLGIMYLIGWEVGIGRSTLSGLIASDGSIDSAQATIAAAWLSWGIVIACLLYTVLGGLRGNASADLSQNIIKIAGLGILAVLLYGAFTDKSAVSFGSRMFPSWSQLKENLGFGGLVTNVIFSLCWQFVDTSTWQNIIASSKANESDSRWNLNWSGIVAFVTPGLLGTFIGVYLTIAADVTAENILVKAVTALPFGPALLAIVYVTIIASIMSLIDGLFLASAYTLVVDVIHPNKRLPELDADEGGAERLLVYVRIALFVIAVVAVSATSALVAHFKINLFDFVYFVIIPQLALFGAVLASFRLRQRTRAPMWIAILASLLVGFACAIGGTAFEMPWLSDCAGTFTVFISLIIAWACSRERVATEHSRK